MPPAPPVKASIRPASVLLLVAWLILLGGLAAAAGYVLMLPREQMRAATQVAVAFGPGEQAETPPSALATADAAPEPVADAAAESAPAPDMPAAAPVPQDTAAAATGSAGALPRWRQYGQDFDDTDTRPRIAVILTGMGLSSAATEAAINQLPAAVTLSFTPYSPRLDQWMSLARSGGHEVMLDLPMEPTSYPDDDPGPQALLTALSPAQNLERLNWTLERASGYVGVATVMGSRFTTSEEALTPVLEALKEQGLIFLDNRSSQDSVAGNLAAKIGVPHAVNDRTLDTGQASPAAIDARLVQVEGLARAAGFAVAMGRPYPVTIARVREWVKGLADRGFVLAPISAVVDRQPRRLGATQSSETK